MDVEQVNDSDKDSFVSFSSYISDVKNNTSDSLIKQQSESMTDCSNLNPENFQNIINKLMAEKNELLLQK